MHTPWGESKEFLYDRCLSLGREPGDAAAIEGSQRRRLLGATVAVVAERGYAGATTDRIAAMAGVSSGAIYRLFGSKEALYLAMVDAVYAEGMRVVGESYRGGVDWEARLRAGFDALVDLLVREPAAAHASVIDIYEAGAAGAARVERGRVGFETLVGRAFAESPRRARVPAAAIAALVGAIEMLIHDFLRRDGTEELRARAPEIMSWMLSYEAAGVSLRGPAGMVEPVDDAAPEDPRARLLLAAVDAVAERGYRRVTVDELARRAGTSLRVLYRAYGGKQACFLAAFEAVRDQALEASEAAYAAEAPWPLKMRAVNRALLGHLAARPSAARMALVEVMGAGRAAVDLRDEVLTPFERFLLPGYESAPAAPPIAAKAIAFAVYAAAARQVAGRGPGSLRRLEPLATYLELAPFLGAARAGQLARGKG